MTTNDTILNYFDTLKEKKDWTSFLADDVVFTSFTSPVRKISGKKEFLEGTKRFYSMIVAVHVMDLIVEGEKACALTHYELQPPAGNPFTSDVAEIFKLKDGKIESLGIYFDSSPFPK